MEFVHKGHFPFCRTDAPEAPSPPSIERISPTSVKLAWSPPNSDGGDKVTGYIIEKKDRFSGRWTPVTKDVIDDTSFTIKGLKEGEEAEFRVVAVNKAGSGKPSQTTVLAASPPGPPGLPSISDVKQTSVTLSWTPSESDGGSKIIGYIVEKKDMGRWVKVNRSPVRETTMVVTDLVEKNEYEFRVMAENKVGVGEPSAPSSRVVAKLPFGKLFSVNFRCIISYYKPVSLSTC